MANMAGSYDQNAEPNQFDRIPAGTYRAKIIESEIVDISSKDDKGRCLNMTWQIETGPHDGRLFWQRLNMWPSANMTNADKVQAIANQQFAAVRQATNKIVVNDSAELHHIACLITIGPQKNDDRYDEVKSVKPVEGTAPSSAPTQNRAPQTTQNRAPPSSSGTGGSAPWRKSA